MLNLAYVRKTLSAQSIFLCKPDMVSPATILQSHQTCQVHNLDHRCFKTNNRFNHLKGIDYRFTDFGIINNPVFPKKHTRLRPKMFEKTAEKTNMNNHPVIGNTPAVTKTSQKKSFTVLKIPEHKRHEPKRTVYGCQFRVSDTI